MRQLNGVYTQGFNRRHGQVGHVLQGRFKAVLVDRDAYLLELCRYVVLNPVRAKTTRKPETYRWSSYRATAGRTAVPPFLAADWVLAQFGKQRAAAQRKRFVAEGVGQAPPWERLQGQVLLGAETFVERLRPALGDKRPIREIPRGQRFATRPVLATLFGSDILSDLDRRNEVIRRAHLEHGYSLSAIG